MPWRSRRPSCSSRCYTPGDPPSRGRLCAPAGVRSSALLSQHLRHIILSSVLFVWDSATYPHATPRVHRRTRSAGVVIDASAVGPPRPPQQQLPPSARSAAHAAREARRLGLAAAAATNASASNAHAARGGPAAASASLAASSSAAAGRAAESSPAPLDSHDAALLHLLRELPSCSPALIIATAAEMLSSRGRACRWEVAAFTWRPGCSSRVAAEEAAASRRCTR